ncbi:acyl carrier protein [Streptomyces solisilvae]
MDVAFALKEEPAGAGRGTGRERRPQVYEDLKGILVDDLQMRAEDVVPTAGREQVGLDSLAAVELATLLGDRYGVEIHDYELLEADTVADIADLVAERRAAAPGATAAAPAPGAS